MYSNGIALEITEVFYLYFYRGRFLYRFQQNNAI